MKLSVLLAASTISLVLAQEGINQGIGVDHQGRQWVEYQEHRHQQHAKQHQEDQAQQNKPWRSLNQLMSGSNPQYPRDEVLHQRRYQQVQQIVPRQQLEEIFQHDQPERREQEYTSTNSPSNRETVPIRRAAETAPSANPSGVPSTSQAPSGTPSTSQVPSISPTTAAPSESQAPSSQPSITLAPSSGPTGAPTKMAFLPSGENAYGNENYLTGPWHECVGWEGQDCKTYILTVTNDRPRVIIANWDVADSYDYHRVRVFTSVEGLVIRRPQRG